MADDTQEPQGLGWGYIIYLQIAGVIGALNIIMFLGHFVSFDWRGAIAELIGVWDVLVRPLIKAILDATVVAFFSWAFRWEITIPLLIRDYISVGLIIYLAFLRVEIFSRRHRNNLQSIVAQIPVRLGFLPERIQLGWMHPTTILPYIAVHVATFLLWPLMLLIFLYCAFREALDINFDLERRIFISYLLILSPVFYFALLLTANYFLLSPGSQ